MNFFNYLVDYVSIYILYFRDGLCYATEIDGTDDESVLFFLFDRVGLETMPAV